ncbi:MAG: hypothetical protein KKA42_02260 [candidate division Zixibacteria bacterium]|nr:hypothetical protein [candidate division Zixibacteria bacterium]
MKKVTIITLGLCLMLASGVLAQDPGLKGKMLASGYLGYSIGMGDAFDDYDFAGSSYSSDAGIAFGGSFHFGLTEKIMLGGELMMQNYSFDVEVAPFDIGGVSFAGESYSDSEMKLNFIGSMLYALNYSDEQALFLTAGLGIYDYGSSEIGFNGGVVWRKMVSPTIGLFVSPRIHLVMADDMFELLQVTAGVHIPLGNK